MITVLGAGNWGTTLSDLIASNGHAVRLWTRDGAQRDEINERRSNERAVPGLRIAAGVTATSELGEAVRGAELVVVVIPSQSFREVSKALGEVLAPEQVVLHATKGLERESNARMTEILLAETCARQIGVISGPNIAAEIAQKKPAGTVIASRFPHVVELGRRALSCDRMMVFGGDDVTGVELAAALKNVVAIAAGVATQMDIGENAKALLVTRGLAEITRLAVAMGAAPLTLAGLAGIGDLMVTCASPLSQPPRGRGAGEGRAAAGDPGWARDGGRGGSTPRWPPATWRAHGASRRRCWSGSTGCSTRASAASRGCES